MLVDLLGNVSGLVETLLGCTDEVVSSLIAATRLISF